MKETELMRETIDMIKQIYRKYPTGGALHIVLDDGNVDDSNIIWCLQNSIIAEKEDCRLFINCAVNLFKLKTNRKRTKCINKAFKELREDANNV